MADKYKQPYQGQGGAAGFFGMIANLDENLGRLETMLDERLQAEAGRADDLAKRLDRLERQHDELKKVALEVEGRLERAMEYIRSLLAADQK